MGFEMEREIAHWRKMSDNPDKKIYEQFYTCKNDDNYSSKIKQKRKEWKRMRTITENGPCNCLTFFF